MANAEDRATAPTRDHTTPFAIAQSMYRNQQPPMPFGETRSGTFDEREYMNTLSIALDNVRRANIPERDIQADPGLLEMAGAAFRQGNSIVGAFSSNTNQVRRDGDESPSLTRLDVIERARRDGLLPMIHIFGDVGSEAMYEATKADLQREQTDQRMLAASGFTGTALLLAAGVMDFPTLLPGGSLLPAARGANLARTMRNVAVAAGLDTAATEAVLQGSQVARETSESFTNIGASVVLGGLLGGAVHKMLGPGVAAKVEGRMDAVIRDGQEGFPEAQRAAHSLVREMEAHIDAGTLGNHRSTAGAAQLNADEQLAARGLDRSDRLFSAGAFESLDMLGRAPGFIGDNLRMPRLELERGATRQERNFVDQFTFNPSISRRQVPGEVSTEGIAAPRSVAADIAVYQGEFAQWVHEASVAWQKSKANYANIDDFAEKVTLALINGDRHADPVVQAVAQSARKRILDPIKDQHIANGNFKEEMQPRNASSYFPLVLDAQAIRNKKEWVIELQKAGYLRDLEEEYRLALVEKEARKSDKEDVQIGARDEKAKTTKEVRAEHEENIRSLRETRENEAARFEQDAVDMREKVRAERDDALTEARETRDEMIGGDIGADEAKAIAYEARDKTITEARTSYNESVNTIRKERGEALAEHDEVAKAARQEAETPKEKAKVEREFNRLRKDIAKRHDDELKATKKERDQTIREAQNAADKEINEAAKERARIERSLKAEEKKITSAYQRESKNLEVRLARERKDLTTKFDKLEDEARTARDKAVGEAEVRAQEQRDASKALGLNEGLSVLRFATREAREQEAERLANGWYNGAVGNTRFILDHEVQNGVRGYGKFRSTPAWHQTMIEQGLAKHNAFDILEHYHRAAGTDAAIGKAFKKPGGKIVKEDGTTEMEMIGDHNLTELRRQVKEEYDALIQSAGGGEKEKALANKRDRALSNIELLRDFARGFQPTDGNASLMRTAEWIGTLNYMRLMGGTVTASLGDPINIALANGFGRSMKYGIVPMITNFADAYKNASGELRKLSRLVMANAEIELNSRMAQMAEIGNPLSQVDPATNFLRNAAKVFSQLSGITYWNSFWKQVAYNTAQARIVDHSIAGWSSLSKAEKTWLNSLGIGQDGLEKIAVAYRGQSGEATVAGIPVARFDSWSDREAAGLMQAALSNESHNMIVTPHFSDKMALNANPATGLLMQFRRFMIANQMRVVGRNIQLASVDDTAAKRLSVASGLFGLAMMGALVDAVKHTMGTTTITGANVDESRSATQRIIDEWNKTPGTALYNALDRSSVFGILFEGSNMLEKMGLPSIRGAVSLAAHDDHSGRREASRFANRSVLESIGGPTFGAIEDAGKLASLSSSSLGYLFGIVEDPHFSRSDYRRGRRFIPFQNIPLVQQVLNEGERHGASIFDWPMPH